jgi:hypothetical protein
VTYPQLPDAEQALITFLTAHTGLAALHGGRVAAELQEPVLTCLQVTALGGVQQWPWEGALEFEIASWGSTNPVTGKGQANALDRAVRSAVFELAGAAVTGGRVVGVALRLAALWSPAEDTARPRYRSDVALTIFP